MLIDLQLHSTYSDGYYDPKQLVGLLKKNGIKVASLTDHNTISGQEQFRAVCQKNGIKAVSGLEMYSQLGSMHFNILWYGLETSSVELHDLLRDSQMRRRRNIRNILKELKKRGFALDVDRIIDRFNHYVPVNRVVDELLRDPANLKKARKEIGTDILREEDVINRYFNNPQIGNLRNSYIDFLKITKLRKKLGGYLVLCHPAKFGNIGEEKIKRLKANGLDGIEALSPHHSYGAVVYIQHLAEKFDLITTGGSDFHKAEDGSQPLKNSWQYFKIDSKNLRRIGEIIK